MKTITAAVDEKYVEALDSVIKSTGMYSSRSEFIKDAVRSKIAELAEFEKALERATKVAEEARKKIKFYRPLTQERREEIARKYLNKISRRTQLASGKAKNQRHPENPAYSRK